jgi:GNAT superfamily N-acetyltransferase
MDEHYRPGEILPTPEAYAAMAVATIRTEEGTRFVLCFAGDEPAGLGCFAVLRPGRDLKGLIFVKDLFVRVERRSQGLGRAMMRFIAGFALEQGINRIDLATDVANEGARKLYEELGGVVRPAVYFTFPESVLRELAKR